ncbi:MAG: hypothetical protein LBO72_02500 [Helicobacteraceae bacterium]|jgi:hypothetical protein|nr:hypothetical protein [Helicobacteraceae bacterium]
MLLPTKGISAERALLTIGAKILTLLNSPATVFGLWERFAEQNRNDGNETRITFDWFALALSMLFTIGAVSRNKNEQLEKHRVFE